MQQKWSTKMQTTDQTFEPRNEKDMKNVRNERPLSADKVSAAMDFAEYYHRGQTRRGAHGRVPYYDEHILGVYRILKEECHVQEEDVLVVALLHDTVEDTSCSLADIERYFGRKIREQVDLLSRVGGEPFSVYAKRLFAAAPSQVVLIKLADRLHNLRTILYMPDTAWIQKKINQTYTDILTPLEKIKTRLGTEYAAEIALLQEKILAELSVTQKKLNERLLRENEQEGKR